VDIEYAYFVDEVYNSGTRAYVWLHDSGALDRAHLLVTEWKLYTASIQRSNTVMRTI